MLARTLAKCDLVGQLVKRHLSEQYYNKYSRVNYPHETPVQRIIRKMRYNANPEQMKSLQPKFMRSYGSGIGLVDNAASAVAARRNVYTI